MMIEDGYMSERCSVLVTSYEALGTMLIGMLAVTVAAVDYLKHTVTRT